MAYCANVMVGQPEQVHTPLTHETDSQARVLTYAVRSASESDAACCRQQ